MCGRRRTAPYAGARRTDPLTLNLYIYATDSPIDNTDPTGRLACADQQCRYGYEPGGNTGVARHNGWGDRRIATNTQEEASTCGQLAAALVARLLAAPAAKLGASRSICISCFASEYVSHLGEHGLVEGIGRAASAQDEIEVEIAYLLRVSGYTVAAHGTVVATGSTTTVAYARLVGAEYRIPGIAGAAGRFLGSPLGAELGSGAVRAVITTAVDLSHGDSVSTTSTDAAKAGLVGASSMEIGLSAGIACEGYVGIEAAPETGGAWAVGCGVFGLAVGAGAAVGLGHRL